MRFLAQNLKNHNMYFIKNKNKKKTKKGKNMIRAKKFKFVRL